MHLRASAPKLEEVLLSMMYIYIYIYISTHIHTHIYIYTGCFTTIETKQWHLFLTLFSFCFQDCYLEIVNILKDLTKYSEIMPWTIEQKIFYVKTYYEIPSFEIDLARYRKKFNFNTFPNGVRFWTLKFMALVKIGSSPSGLPTSD